MEINVSGKQISSFERTTSSNGARLHEVSVRRMRSQINTETADDKYERVVHVNQAQHSEHKPYTNNLVVTSKYNVLTFIPKFFFFLFTQASYLYFLVQALLAWTPISPFSGLGPTTALSFVALVAAVKAIIEDLRRRKEDTKQNGRITHVLRNGSLQSLRWDKVRVGDVLCVCDGEQFPADILCIQSGIPDGVAFIKTTNLDGESNLKLRIPVQLPDCAHIENVQLFQDTLCQKSNQWSIQCEAPCKDLSSFNGVLLTERSNKEKTHEQLPLNINNILLRGCLLKNSGHVFGVVLYAGRESRIQMNAGKTQTKSGAYDKFLNFHVIVVMLFQLGLCIACAIGGYIWRQSEGVQRAHLAASIRAGNNWKNPFLYIFFNTLTFWVLYSYMVPVSLFVSIEVVKFFQGMVIMPVDETTQDEAPVEPAPSHLPTAVNQTNIGEGVDQQLYSQSSPSPAPQAQQQLPGQPLQGSQDGSSHHGQGVVSNGKPSVSGLIQSKGSGQLGSKTSGLKNKLKMTGGLLAAGLGVTPGMWARNTSINEDLGLIKYVFSDKTGTLTANEMQLRQIAINGVVFGRMDCKLERMSASSASEALHQFDSVLSSIVKNTAPHQVSQKRVIDYFTCLMVCHTLIIDPDSDSNSVLYQGPSPDEIALVQAAKTVGFEFSERSANHVTGKNLHTQETLSFELLQVFEFNSERKRMSVIVKDRSGNIRIYSKGADIIMLKLLKDTTCKELDATYSCLQNFSEQGLRTLVCGYRTIGQSEYDEWNLRYQQCLGMAGEQREAMVSEMQKQMECGITLLGVTAIEDRLADEVPETIDKLLRAGMKVWMITGDKKETAINIAVSCKLFKQAQNRVILSGQSAQELKEQLQQCRQKMEQILTRPIRPCRQHSQTKSTDASSTHFTAKNHRHGNSGTIRNQLEMVLDGATLDIILQDKAQCDQLAVIAEQCGSVVVCRASPSQKRAVVTMIMNKQKQIVKESLPRWTPGFYVKHKHNLTGKILAIGDGANDVAMIQGADVGVGIAGKEGRQAVNNADYALTQFKFLQRLLFVHGHLSQYRLSNLVKYSFYKNIAFATMNLLFQFSSGFSGQTLIESIAAALYNALFTSLPIFFFAIFDRPVQYLNTLMYNPQVYNTSPSLTDALFWKSGFGLAIFTGAVCFYPPYYAVQARSAESIHDIYSIGKLTYMALLGAVLLEVLVISRSPNLVLGAAMVVSYGGAYCFLKIFDVAANVIGVFDAGSVGATEVLLKQPTFWLVMLLAYGSTFGIRFFERYLKFGLNPDPTMRLAIKEAQAQQSKTTLPVLAERLHIKHEQHVSQRLQPSQAVPQSGASTPGQGGVLELVAQQHRQSHHT